MSINVPDSPGNEGNRTGGASMVAGTLAAQARLVAALRDAAIAKAAGARIAVIETHISYVLLTGPYAYKIKKAVALPFLDFRTLPARRFYCDEELRLNRRFAPQLYVDVIPITGSVDAPHLGGEGTAIEYAVKMREFPQDALASVALARGELTSADIDALAAKVAAAHRSAGVAPPGSRFGAPDLVLGVASRNFAEIRPLLDSGAELAELAAIEGWTIAEHARRAGAMAQRRDHGYVRECHGDLHLGNIARVDGALTIFDCIEFNEAMRWIDVTSEIAFTVMDLRDRGRSDFSHRFLNRYLEITGDYEGLGVLRFHLVYRAMVRAKIARLRAAQLAAGDAKGVAMAEYRGYLHLASRYTEPSAVAIVVTHGLSGSGKSTLSQMLLEQTGAIRLRTDVERRRPTGPTPRDDDKIDTGRYAPEATRQLYGQLRNLARVAIEAGWLVIVDGAFLKRWQRQGFRELAQELTIPFLILSFDASVATLRHRIAQRLRGGEDASEADLGVLEHQLQTQEPLAADEMTDAIAYDSELPPTTADGSAPWQTVFARIGAGMSGRPR